MSRFYFSIIAFSLCFFSSQVFSQVGGQHIYEFINLSPSARVSAMGGNLITVKDWDASLAYSNPSLLNPTMYNQVNFSTNFLFAGINHGYASYASYSDRWDLSWHAGIQYINYGTFDEADIFGNRTGTFNASEYALTVGASRQLYDRLSVGANLKIITSQLESYNSFGLAGDLAATYMDTSSNLTFALVFRNIGGQITTYNDAVNEEIPFDLQFGISKRLKYLPLRLSVIAHHLHRWNILYDDPNSEEDASIIGDFVTDTGGNPDVDNFFRHFIFNLEFLLGKRETLMLRAGYNHFRRQELSVDNFRSLAGFSMGFGIKIKKFRIDYGHSIYHLAGGSHHLGISTNLNEFR